MSGREVSRQTWAEIVRELIARETKGNKSEFVRLTGTSYTTVQRWLRGDVEVSEESVRQVARAVHIPPMDLLVRVGFYAPDDLAPTAQLDQDDPALRVILEADVPPRVKQRMIHRLQQMREREREQQLDEVRWWIEQAGA